MTDLRQLRIGCMFTYLAQVPTAAVFMVRPAASAAVAMQGGRWLTDPSVPVHDYTDIYGNECARTVLPAGRSRFGFSGRGHRAGRHRGLRPGRAGAAARRAARRRAGLHAAQPLLPARHARQRGVARFSALPPGYSRVQAICDHVNDHLQFPYGSTAATSTAVDVNASRVRGVPRLHPPGDLVLPGDEHPRPLRVRVPAGHGRAAGPDTDGLRRLDGGVAGRPLVDVRPRNNIRRKGRVLIGRGRDAADVAMATTFGGPILESMTVDLAEVPD